jgi:hypothetical protein
MAEPIVPTETPFTIRIFKIVVGFWSESSSSSQIQNFCPKQPRPPCQSTVGEHQTPRELRKSKDIVLQTTFSVTTYEQTKEKK